MSRTCTSAVTGLLMAIVLLGQSPCEPEPVTCFFEEPGYFQSVEQLECGMGPDGINYCNWSLSFDQSQFTWMHSDVGEIGKYTCDGDMVIGDTGYSSYSGTWDASTGILTWEGVAYVFSE